MKISTGVLVVTKGTAAICDGLYVSIVYTALSDLLDDSVCSLPKLVLHHQCYPLKKFGIVGCS